MKLTINDIFFEQFKYAHGSVMLNASDITAFEALIFPDNEANCLNWVMGHMIDARNQVLVILKLSPVWTNANWPCYARGSQPKDEKITFMSFEKLNEHFAESHARMVAGIKNILPEQFSELHAITTPGGQIIQHTILEWLTTFSYHESYHAGQTGILRRMLGKEGKIK